LGPRVELFEAIRRVDVGIWELAKRRGVDGCTMLRPWPRRCRHRVKPRTFAAPRLLVAKPLIDGMLRTEVDEAPRKRRLAAQTAAERASVLT
jgi:hypothetical protein